MIIEMQEYSLEWPQKQGNLQGTKEEKEKLWRGDEQHIGIMKGETLGNFKL